MKNHLNDKVVVVTGAASGFGELISTKAAALGARVVCSDVNAKALTATCDTIRAAGGAVSGFVTDVTDLERTKALAHHALTEFERIDVWVNNAGIMPLAFYSDHEKAAGAWSRCIDVNIKGVLNGILAAYDPMIAQGCGHVVNISSIYGNFPVAGAAVYGATKAAVNYLSESLRIESQGKIKVTIVKPSGVPTTGIASSVVNMEAVGGAMGSNAREYGQAILALTAGNATPEGVDPDRIEYLALEADQLVEQVIYAINQPWGVSIGEVTVRASGEGYVI